MTPGRRLHDDGIFHMAGYPATSELLAQIRATAAMGLCADESTDETTPVAAPLGDQGPVRMGEFAGSTEAADWACDPEDLFLVERALDLLKERLAKPLATIEPPTPEGPP